MKLSKLIANALIVNEGHNFGTRLIAELKETASDEEQRDAEKALTRLVVHHLDNGWLTNAMKYARVLQTVRAQRAEIEALRILIKTAESELSVASTSANPENVRYRAVRRGLHYLEASEPQSAHHSLKHYPELLAFWVEGVKEDRALRRAFDLFAARHQEAEQ